MASAVVSIGPEPEKPAMSKAAAHTVVDRVMVLPVVYEQVPR